MERKIVICDRDKDYLTAVIENDRITELWIDRKTDENIVGNIYVGKVQNIIRNIQAAFVKVSENITCYLPLSSDELKEIKQQDEVVVQIAKAAVKTKQPVGTKHYSLNGRFCVVMKDSNQCAVSSKITNDSERSRLLSIAREYEGKGYGIIIRTNAKHQSDESIRQELEELFQKCQSISDSSVYSSCYACLYHAPEPVLKRIRDYPQTELEKIIVSSKELYQKLLAYMNDFAIITENRLCLDEDDSFPLNKKYSMDTVLEKALMPNVWLKSGGSLYIEQTEALTVIDVNTGKAIRTHKKKEEMFFSLNCEAAKEIALQIRLRNLSGIIIVDFIDMEEERHKEELFDVLRKYCQMDSTKTVVVDITALGLVEMTRQKINKSLHEQVYVKNTTDC